MDFSFKLYTGIQIKGEDSTQEYQPKENRHKVRNSDQFSFV